MKLSKLQTTIFSVMLASALVFTMPVGAQMGGGMMGDTKSDAGMNQMSGMMHDMADHMMSMSGDMSKGNMTTDQQKMMSERMGKFATMMDHMSNIMGKGMMMDDSQQKQMGEMRMQMDNMMGN